MKFWGWPQKDPEPTNEDYHEMRRREDPEYDEKRRVHAENVKLRHRRDFLRQQRENADLQREVDELERRAITPNRGNSPCVCGHVHPCCRFLVDGGCPHSTPGDHHHAPRVRDV